MNEVIIFLSGRIDSLNATQVQQDILDQLEGKEIEALMLDLSDLSYISSAGLRMVLHIRKEYPTLSLVNVSLEVYETLEITGFTQIMPVQRAYRTLCVEGCEIIGEGANGIIYRIDRDHVVKLIKTGDLEEIQRTRETSQLAFVLGIPTAIPYDIVRIGDGYGAVFELLDAQPFSVILAKEPEKTSWCVREYTDVLKLMHGTQVPPGRLPSAKQQYLHYLSRIKEELPTEDGDKIERMIRDLPEPGTMLHGDYHVKNIVLASGEVLLIDMETLSVGHPVFDLAQMYIAYVGFALYNPARVENFLGLNAEMAGKFWDECLRSYLGTREGQILQEIEDKIRVVAFVRLVEWGGRHLNPNNPEETAERKLWVRELIRLLKTVDTLHFEDTLPAGMEPVDRS